MRRLPLAIVATTLVSLAASMPAAAASKAASGDESCAITKGEMAPSIKNRLAFHAGGADVATVTVYRIGGSRQLSRAHVVLHRPNLRLDAPIVVAANKDGHDGIRSSGKERAPGRDLSGGLGGPVKAGPVSLLLSAYA